ncbi:MAG: LLM class flavin-dependent oxidoreductase [Chloroflexi bacterium]|nr:LLM class flavin-dependent oxidoreductase [Chloroflexota bacterium]
MPELAIVLPAGYGQLRAIGDAARRAEAKGFSAVYSPEGNSDSLANMLTAALATSRVGLGTAISNIYLRHPVLTAASAAHVWEVSGGRFTLGLGTSHRLLNDGRGIQIVKPLETMRNYVRDVRRFLPRDHPVPIHISALRKGMSRLAGEVADGVIFNLVPVSKLPEAIAAVREGEARRADKKRVKITTFLGACVHQDVHAARETARKMLAFYLRLEYYRNALTEYGYGDVAAEAGRLFAAGDEKGMTKAVPDSLLDEFMLYGPRERCLEHLQRYYAKGIELAIISARDPSDSFTKGFEAAVEGLAPGAR